MAEDGEAPSRSKKGFWNAKSTKRKLHGGPWAGESIGFREDQTELRLLDYRDSRRPVYIGRYVVHKIQQKNRVITKVEWETAEDRSRLVKRRLRQPGIRIY